MERQPLEFVDRTLLPLLVHSMRRLAKFLNAEPVQIAPLPNATFGLNSAISSLIRHGDVVAYLDTRYGSVAKMLRVRAQDVGAALHEIPVQALIHSETLGDDTKLTEYIADRVPTNCSVFVIDHITSNTAFEYPIFTHIIPMLRNKGVKHIIVDGAHGPLQCNLDFKSNPNSLPTVYVGNLHKWVSTPKSVGFMWVQEDAKDLIRSPIVSHGYGSGFLSQFVWCGTTDYGATLALPSVLDFWETAGVDKVRSYCEDTMSYAKDMLQKAFGVESVARSSPFLALVKLPAVFQEARDHLTSKAIQDWLYHRRIEVPVKDIAGSFYVRISVMIYNRREDYDVLRDAIKELAAKIESGQFSLSE